MKASNIREMARVKLRSKPLPERIRHDRFEKEWRNRIWRHFSMTRSGRLSWANWFYLKKEDKRRCLAPNDRR